jgi:hypothetical protein
LMLSVTDVVSHLTVVTSSLQCKLHMLQMKEGFLLNAFGANGMELMDIANSPYPELDLAAQIGRTSQGNVAKCLKVYSKCLLSTKKLKENVL